MRQTLVILLLLLASASGSDAQKKETHASKAEASKADGWADVPVVPEEMSSRIEEAAAEHQGTVPLPRAGFFEVAYPADVPEYVALAGNGIVLITVFAQDKNELPIKKAYFHFEDGLVELQPIASVLSKQKEADAKTSKAFGAYRMDALYLLPLHLGFEGANLMVEFAKSRNAFRLGSISGSTSSVREGEQTKTLAGKPSEEAVKSFVEREYPGFVKK
jgi:hypothetical protein